MGFTAVAAFTAVASAQQQRKSAKQQRRAIKAQQRIADVKAEKERTSQLRRARAARASVLANIAASGAAGSSAQVGGLGQIQGQLAGNLQFADKTQVLSREASSANLAAARAEGQAALFSTAASSVSTLGDAGLFNQGDDLNG